MSIKGKRINKSVIYKRAEFHTAIPGQSLKTMIDKALRKRATIGERKSNVADDDQPIFHLLGQSQSEPKGFLFGVFMAYTPGTDPLFLVDDEQASNITLEKLKAPKMNDGKRREVLESIMYFGVFDNHLVLVQSQALKAPQLEIYLQWLLHQAAALPGDNTVRLIDKPSKAVREKMQKARGVRAIKLGSEVMPASVMPAIAAKGKGSQTKSVSVTANQSVGGGSALEALKSLLNPVEAAKINFDQLVGSNIELTVTLRYNRTTTDDGQKLMDTLGSAFRHSDGVETELELIGGGSIKGSELKLDGTIRVSSYDGQLSASEVFEGMRQWLLSKVSSDDL